MAEGDVITDADPFPPHLYPWLRQATDDVTPVPGMCPGPASRDRTLVVAVGSNAAPAVLRAKLLPGSPIGTGDLRSLPVRVGNLAVGHSAHVSHRGYIAAAPRHSPGAVLDTIATWLDPTQLALLDRTEPNYRRIRLRVSTFPVVPTTGEPLPDHIELYDSAHGVLADPATGTALPFTDQQTLFNRLRAMMLEPTFDGNAADICARLADPANRDRLTARMNTAAIDSGMSSHAVGFPPALAHSS